MAARQFIKSSLLSSIELVDIDDVHVLESYAKLHQLLIERCGSDVAALFAEPVLSRGNGTAPTRVDWYTIHDGSARKLADLDVSTADAARRKLQDRLLALQPLIHDPQTGPLVAACLNLKSADSILSISSEPVLVEWGLLPLIARESPHGREDHFRNTLGQVLSGFPVPPISLEEWQQRFGATHTGKGHEPLPPSPSSSVTGARTASWRAPAVSVSIAGAALLLSFLPGMLVFPKTVLSGGSDAKRLHQAVLENLIQRRGVLEAALSYDCLRLATDGATLVPPNPADVRLAPPAPPGTPAAAPPAARTDPTAVSPINLDLPERIERGVVMIIADDAIGTGFFISRDLVVTNRHVVEQARRLFIAGKYVGLAPAQPVALGRETALTDFALLRVSPQPSVMPFGLAVPSRPMTPIIAAGYPGLHLTTDVMYQRLRSGDATAAAGLSPVFQTGVVSHLQPHAEQAVTLVIHGAEIAPGNSGGPLLDYCGRVVGVNTFGRTEERLPVTARYALGSDGLGAFLLSAGQDAALASEPCQPTTSNTEAASRAPASAETGDSPASGQAEPPLPGPASAPVPGAALAPGSAPVSGSPPGGPSAPAGIPAVRGDRALGSSPTQGATPASGPAGPRSDRATPPASSTPPSQGAPARRPIPTEPSSLSRTPPVPVPPAAPR